MRKRRTAHRFGEKRRTADVLTEEKVDFSGLMLSNTVLEGLKSAGFERPSPIQLKAIPLGRCGLDLIAQAKSGTGKTCVFSVIALENINLALAAIQVLVLAPTREIAVQIKDVVCSIGRHMEGLQVKVFIGGISVEEDKRSLKGCHVAVGTPGRVKFLIESKLLKPDSIRLFILDEADKLLDENFQSQTNWIFSTLPSSKQMLALSATYTDHLAEHLRNYMKDPTFVRLSAQDPALEGIRHFRTIVPFHSLPHKVFQEKVKSLLLLLSKLSFHQCLIFSNYQIRARNLSETLAKNGWPSTYISGSQGQKERLKAMEKLKEFKCRILISTDLTSRGIDAERVNLVINMDVPRDSETYLHRVGRAGRFGSYGVAISFVAEGKEMANLDDVEAGCGIVIGALPEDISQLLSETVMFGAKRPNNDVTTGVTNVKQDVNGVRVEGKVESKKICQDKMETERSSDEEANENKGDEKEKVGDSREGPDLLEAVPKVKGEFGSVASFESQFSVSEEEPANEKPHDGKGDYKRISDEKLSEMEPVEDHNSYRAISEEERGKKEGSIQECTGYVTISNEKPGSSAKECIEDSSGYLGIFEDRPVENENFDGKCNKDGRFEECFGSMTISEKRDNEQCLVEESDYQNPQDQSDGKGYLQEQPADMERVGLPSGSGADLVERYDAMEHLGEPCKTKKSLGEPSGTEEHSRKQSDVKKRLEEQGSYWVTKEICGNEESLGEICGSKKRLEEQGNDGVSDEICENEEILSEEQNDTMKFSEEKRGGDKPPTDPLCNMQIFEKTSDSTKANGDGMVRFGVRSGDQDRATLHNGVGCSKKWLDKHNAKEHSVIFRQNQVEDSFQEMEKIWLPVSSDESESSCYEETMSETSCDETSQDLENVPISSKDFDNVLEAYLKTRVSEKPEDFERHSQEVPDRITISSEPRTLVGSPSHESWFPIVHNKQSQEQPFQTSNMNSDRDNDFSTEERPNQAHTVRDSNHDNNLNQRGFEETGQESENSMFYGASADDLSAYLSALPAKWKQIWYRSYERQTNLISTYSELYQDIFH